MDTLGEAILSFMERLSFLGKLTCTRKLKVWPLWRGFYSIVSFIGSVLYQRSYIRTAVTIYIISS